MTYAHRNKKPASGGEYQVQQGFGWTNGVTSRFYTLL
ncbi:MULTISPECIES: trehalase family glycosidase [Pseudoalteromonas]|nr:MULTISPECIES: trehalase family glycosidase [unclassified Pseudoalteromonas]